MIKVYISYYCSSLFLLSRGDTFYLARPPSVRPRGRWGVLPTTPPNTQTQAWGEALRPAQTLGTVSCWQPYWGGSTFKLNSTPRAEMTPKGEEELFFLGV